MLTKITLALVLIGVPTIAPAAETVALWLFDEPVGLYPSTPLDSAEGLDAPVVLGLGGTIVPGKFGQALSTKSHPPVKIPATGEATAALNREPVPTGRTQEPLTWHNAQFAALMTGGEKHIRKEVSFVSATGTNLNLGDFDWTVEFWYRPAARDGNGVVLEIGQGPRGENDVVTRLSLNSSAAAFVFENQPSNTRTELRTSESAISNSNEWHHYAFTYRADARQLVHYLDGRRQSAADNVALKKLPRGEEDYLTLGRDAFWRQPLSGLLDEVRISKGLVYTAEFSPPASFAARAVQSKLQAGPPLMFAKETKGAKVLPLGSRKHVFIDSSFIEKSDHINFVAHRPHRVERVMEGITGQFRKHLTAIEDDKGNIRIYNGGPDDYLMVHTSSDGVHFEEVNTGIQHKGRRNIVIPEAAPLGRVMLDPNGPPDQRWKYLSGFEGRGVYLYTSPDGLKWTRHRTAAASFRSGSQSSFFYDEQRQRYVAYHRTGFPLSEGGATRREFVLSETTDISKPWPIPVLSQEQIWKISKTRPLRQPQPWWLDNGPLTPGDFGVELPTVFAPDPKIDPSGSGVYVPKAMKYPWATDTYFAFPCMYFDYEEPGQPEVRRTLMEERRKLGSGLVEVQLAVSRDGVEWQRYPSPTFVGVGEYEGRRLHQIYMSEGMIRRGDEIWQYFYGQEEYHSPVKRNLPGNGVYRTVMRLDGFVSANAPYDKLATLTTRAFTFEGDRLVLNIDTSGLGYAQVGIIDERGKPVPGFGLDDCVYINGNFVRHPVEWLGKGHDVSSLAGKPVRLVIRMRNSNLFSLQFTSAEALKSDAARK